MSADKKQPEDDTSSEHTVVDAAGEETLSPLAAGAQAETARRIEQQEHREALLKEGTVSDDTPNELHGKKSEEPFPLADAGPYYKGMWGDTNVALFECPVDTCHWNCLSKKGPEDGNGRTEMHIIEKANQGDLKHRQVLEGEGGNS